MIFLTFILYIFSLWISNAWHDADFKNGKDHHISGAVLACLAVAGLFMFELCGIKTNDFNDFFNIIFLILSLRWIVFDISYNLIIGQKWYYKGSTATMDKYIPNWIAFGIKFVCLFYDVLITRSYV